MTAQIQSQTLHKDSLLRWALYGDAVFSGVSGLVCVVAANPIAAVMGVAPAWIIAALGVFFLGYAAVVWYAASRRVLDRNLALLFVIGNGVWVIGSIVLLLTNWVPMTGEGRWIVALAAAAVDALATLQFVGWRRVQ